jgi:hypothetical protein
LASPLILRILSLIESPRSRRTEVRMGEGDSGAIERPSAQNPKQENFFI